MTRVWLFDLDNTLHNATPHIFPHINRAMTAYLSTHLALSHEDANLLRMRYWLRYGATLRGLIRHHGTDPHHFLHHTHQFPDLATMLVFDPVLRHRLRRLPGRKIVFSNAPRAYVKRVLRLTGLTHLFDLALGLEDLRFHPKPHSRAYRAVLRRARCSAGRCVLVEDTAANLLPARRLGMRTILIGTAGRPAWVHRRLATASRLRG